MRLIQFFLILFIFVSTNVVAEEEKRSSVLSILQKLGAGFGQAEQELLPPDEAFKFSIEVRDEHTLIANLIPAKDYYLYRDKIAFEPKSDGIDIEKITLPPGKMKEDQTFGKTEVYYQPVQAVISLKREVPAVNQLSLAATYQGCNEPIGVCYAPIKKENDITLPTIKAALNTAAETISGNAAAANVDAAAELFQTPAGLPAIETESYKIEQMFASGNFWLILTGFFWHRLIARVYAMRFSHVSDFIGYYCQ